MNNFEALLTGWAAIYTITTFIGVCMFSPRRRTVTA